MSPVLAFVCGLVVGGFAYCLLFGLLASASLRYQREEADEALRCAPIAYDQVEAQRRAARRGWQ